jgi:hypothetical protein
MDSCDSSDDEAERELGGSSSGSMLRVSRVRYKNGLFSEVVRVCSDAGNGLVWCAGDGGPHQGLQVNAVQDASIKDSNSPDVLCSKRHLQCVCVHNANTAISEIQHMPRCATKGCMFGVLHAECHSRWMVCDRQLHATQKTTALQRFSHNSTNVAVSALQGTNIAGWSKDLGCCMQQGKGQPHAAAGEATTTAAAAAASDIMTLVSYQPLYCAAGL